jgi:hypothetical protein
MQVQKPWPTEHPQIRFLVLFFFTQLWQFAKISRSCPNTGQQKNNEVVLTEEL